MDSKNLSDFLKVKFYNWLLFSHSVWPLHFVAKEKKLQIFFCRKYRTSSSVFMKKYKSHAVFCFVCWLCLNTLCRYWICPKLGTKLFWDLCLSSLLNCPDNLFTKLQCYYNANFDKVYYVYFLLFQVTSFGQGNISNIFLT